MSTKILIIEDSKTSCLQYKNYFEMKNFEHEIVFANTYTEASRILREHKDEFRAAIVDLVLPDCIMGHSVKLVNSHKIPMVVSTATVDEGVKKIILKKGVIDYVLKGSPYFLEKIYNTINAIVRKYDTTVLVVDDSALYRHQIKKILENQYITVIEAENGLEGLRAFESNENKIELIITDYNMPELDGMEMVGAIRQKYDKDEVSIIILSAVDEKNVISEFIKLGANDYFIKPFDSEEFETRINLNLEYHELFTKIREQTNRDYLTGAYNRRFFLDSGKAILTKNLRKEKSIALAMLDIDGFQTIVDKYGYDIGDIAIKKVKNVLDKNIRSSDLVALFREEKFSILLEDISREDVEILFEKVRLAFESNVIETGNISFSYTVSIGIVYAIEDSLDSLIKKSLEVLYKAKGNGGNSVEFV